MKEIIILFSGGSDSILLLEMALSMGYNPLCLIVNYEQLNKEEINYAFKYLDKNRIRRQLVKISGLNIRSGLTTHEKNLYKGVDEMYVPSRNLMFISIASSIAENRNIDMIWYGADWVDNNFPDCKSEWVKQLDVFLKINNTNNITLEAPLLGLSKKHVNKLLESVYDVNLNEVYSGYGDL